MAHAPKVPNKYAKTRRGNATVWIANVDGRTFIARRMREVSAMLAANLPSTPTEAQIAIISRASTLIAWCEDQESAYARGEEFDVAAYNATTNTLRRLLRDIGLEPTSKDITPSIAEYMSTK
jgi:nitrogenase molybdenum-iron protein alpha/beta subunit